MPLDFSILQGYSHWDQKLSAGNTVVGTMCAYLVPNTVVTAVNIDNIDVYVESPTFGTGFVSGLNAGYALPYTLYTDGVTSSPKAFYYTVSFANPSFRPITELLSISAEVSATGISFSGDIGFTSAIYLSTENSIWSSYGAELTALAMAFPLNITQNYARWSISMLPDTNVVATMCAALIPNYVVSAVNIDILNVFAKKPDVATGFVTGAPGITFPYTLYTNGVTADSLNYTVSYLNMKCARFTDILPISAQLSATSIALSGPIGDTLKIYLSTYSGQFTSDVGILTANSGACTYGWTLSTVVTFPNFTVSAQGQTSPWYTCSASLGVPQLVVCAINVDMLALCGDKENFEWTNPVSSMAQLLTCDGTVPYPIMTWNVRYIDPSGTKAKYAHTDVAYFKISATGIGLFGNMVGEQHTMSNVLCSLQNMYANFPGDNYHGYADYATFLRLYEEGYI